MTDTEHHATGHVTGHATIDRDRASAGTARGDRCWVCGQGTRRFWANDALEALECQSCGHICAEHRELSGAPGADYHLDYDQGDFLAALAVTRRRQAGRLLDALQVLADPPRALFDFGCGRGFFLDLARERGVERLAGGDVSDLALQLLRERGLPALKLDAVEPFERLDLSQLPFLPEALLFLDVLEHFSGDLIARLRPWLRALPGAVRYLVIKVPVREGLLFAMASGARHLRVESLGKQLFQVGTFPPHYQYFSQGSLERFVGQLGLRPVTVLDDLDFEPEELGRRMSGASAWMRRLAPLGGQLLGAAARISRKMDSRIVIAQRAG
jgi:SAM-dependent methyltransferase